jgi:hypothetical protein
VISDLLVDQHEMEQAIRVARAAGHQVTVLHIMDPSELELDSPGDAIFYDPESTLEVTASVSDVRQAYATTVRHAIEEWRLKLAALGAGYEMVRTDSPFGVPLRKAFATRQRLP